MSQRTLPVPASQVQPAAAWEVTRRCHAALASAALRMGGIVKVPDLADAVRQQLPGLGVAEFHRLLTAWQAERRLVVQVCNDPDLEPRAAEGIRTPSGLRFYVLMLK
jgi:hypothetical protein